MKKKCQYASLTLIQGTKVTVLIETEEKFIKAELIYADCLYPELCYFLIPIEGL